MDITSVALRLATQSDDPVGDVVAILQAELNIDSPPAWPAVSSKDSAICVSAFGRQEDVTVDEIVAWIHRGESVFVGLLGRVLPDLSFGSPSRTNLQSELVAARESGPRISLQPTDEVYSGVKEEVSRRIVEGGSIGLVGPSASGKSVLLHSVTHSHQRSRRFLWIDLADPRFGLAGFLAELATILQQPGLPVCVVLDDAQSSPVVAESILRFLKTTELPSVQWVCAGWPSVVDLVARFALGDSIIYTDAGDLCRKIVGSVSASSEVSEVMLGLANGNALVAELAAEAYGKSGLAPSISDLARLVYESSLRELAFSQGELATLRHLACLGMFEIDADESLFDRESQKSIRSLLEQGVCRRNGPYVFFGHRTVARLLVHHLDSNRLVENPTSPVRVAVHYLREAGPIQLKVTLDRLDLISIAGSDDQFGAAFLARCWTALNVLTHHLAHQVDEDPTWGDNVASAVFAAEAFAEVGMHAEWGACAEYVRGRWLTPANEPLPLHTEGATHESDDFSTIQQRMIQEDAEDAVDEWIPGSDVDLDRFHRTWVLGLLLGFEGKAMDRDADRLRELLRMAEVSLDATGGYYPARVPWVTARVLIGLAACGRTVQVSEVATRAAGWLRTRPPAGPARIGGTWRSGTGTWNTDLQITALVLLSLGRAGVDPADRVVRSGLQRLRSGRSEWYRPGKEIDAAQGLEAALVLGGQWREYEAELRSLLQWCQDSRSWQGTRELASVSQDESSKVPAVASALIAVIWETVRSELPLLLQGLVGEGDTGVDAHIEAQLVRSERELNNLKKQIETEVQNRRQVIARGNAAEEIRQAFEQWNTRLVRAEEVKQRLTDLRATPDAPATTALVEEIDALGVDILGDAYSPIGNPP
ncbi:hypothetical protein [Tersicoccus phoenicis]|uniref:hypothetical protein n=1 Tax=Tersicoccus phoenicis TaxID=554083 RepID=UPI00117F744C|nr:hypothetical protein [Tersicoccus phoenicis]